jgi:hypothetical protein
MVTFDPNDPFPSLSSDQYSYEEAQLHAAEVDEWLGLKAELTEVDLLATDMRERSSQRRQELWIGLPVRSLLTPYIEIRMILNELGLLPGQTVIDLGAGYGRMGFVVGREFPKMNFIGYEFVKERVLEGQRCLANFNYPDVKLLQADLAAPEFAPVPADAYFIYDYGTRDAIAKTLEDLRTISQDRAIAVVGRGRASRDAIERENPWLSQVIPPVHFANYSIYRSARTV